MEKDLKEAGAEAERRERGGRGAVMEMARRRRGPASCAGETDRVWPSTGCGGEREKCQE